MKQLPLLEVQPNAKPKPIGDDEWERLNAAWRKHQQLLNRRREEHEREKAARWAQFDQAKVRR